MDTDAVEQLKQGEDRKAREHLCDGLISIAINSYKGEISLAEFVEGTEEVIKLANQYKKVFDKVE